jgi:uncharacterized membrane protein SirB2
MISMHIGIIAISIGTISIRIGIISMRIGIIAISIGMISIRIGIISIPHPHDQRKMVKVVLSNLNLKTRVRHDSVCQKGL